MTKKCATTMSGTARLLLCYPISPATSLGYLIAVDGLPPTADPPSAGRVLNLDVDAFDLGDYECTALPFPPDFDNAGLWVLRWPWTMVPHPHDPHEQTARYGPAGEWSRPTHDDLVSFLLLPRTDTNAAPPQGAS